MKIELYNKSVNSGWLLKSYYLEADSKDKISDILQNITNVVKRGEEECRELGVEIDICFPEIDCKREMENLEFIISRPLTKLEQKEERLNSREKHKEKIRQEAIKLGLIKK